MARLVLHIGQHKTGTSAIQRALRSNADVLAGQGWDYPRFLKAANHVQIPLIFAEFDYVGHRKYPRLATADGRQEALAWLDEGLRQRVRPDSKWLMSSEEFAGSLDEPQVAACVAFLRTHYEQIDAIYYVRRQDHLLAGIYTEFLKNVPYFDLDESLADERPSMFGQRATIEAWQRALGPGHLIVRPYLERFRQQPGALPADFSAATGTPEVRAKRRAGTGLKNQGLAAETVALLRGIRPDQERILAAPGDHAARLLREMDVGRAMAPFCGVEPGGIGFSRPEFVRAIGILARGARFTPSAGAAEAVLRRYEAANLELVDSLGGGPGWHEWLADAGPEAGHPLSITDERRAELLAQLADWQERGTAPPTRDRQPPTVVRRTKAVVKRVLRR